MHCCLLSSEIIGQASDVQTVKAEKQMMAQMKLDSDSVDEDDDEDEDDDAVEDKQGGNWIEMLRSSSRHL